MHKDLIRITSNFSIYENDRLGNGNFGTVYRGYFSDGRIDVAVKIIEKDKFKQYAGLYYRQAHVLNKLNKLPGVNSSHVVRMFGHAVYNKEGYLFFELCEKDLSNETQGMAQEEAKVIKYFKQIMVGLNFLHSNGVIHRDIKQENILIDKEGNLKITDFGLSKEFEIGMEMKMTEKIGSYIYQAPEVQTKTYDKRSDVWSAGLILYELLTDLPWKDTLNKTDVDRRNRAIKDGKFKLSFPGYDPIWERLVKKMLTYEYSQRPTSAQVLQEFLNWLSAIEGKSLEKELELPEPKNTLFKTFTQFERGKQEEIPIQRGDNNNSEKKIGGKEEEQQHVQNKLMNSLSDQNRFSSVRNYIEYLNYYNSYKRLSQLTIKRIVDLIVHDPNLKSRYRSFFVLTFGFFSESAIFLRYRQLLEEMEKLKGRVGTEKDLDENQREAYLLTVETKRLKFAGYVNDYLKNYSKTVKNLLKYQEKCSDIPHYVVVFNYLKNIEKDDRAMTFNDLIEQLGVLLEDIDYNLSREALEQLKEGEVTVMFLCKRLREITEEMSEGFKIMRNDELTTIKKALKGAKLGQMMAYLKPDK